MLPLVNEWQLQGQLNQALAAQHRADFSLWLAMLSPAVEEFAQFYPLPLPDSADKPDIYQKLGVVKAREFAIQPDDLAVFNCQHQALVQDGFTQWRLQALLQPAATVVRHDAKKLAAEVEDNLSLHTKRRLAGQGVAPTAANPVLLYDMLQTLHA